MARTGTQYRHGEAVGCWEDGPFGGREVVYGEGTFACPDLVLVHLEDGPGAYPCGAPAEADDEGRVACDAGHRHVPLEVQAREGWAIAEDHGEAVRLRALGVDVVEAF